MIKRVDNPSEWAAETAQRLKRVRDSWSDQPVEVQKLNVDEELEFCLADVGAQSGELRENLMGALSEHEALFLPKAPVGEPVEEDGDEAVLEKMMALWGKASVAERDDFKEKVGLSELDDFGELVIAAEHFKPLRPVFQLPLKKKEAEDLEKVCGEFREYFQIHAEKKVSITMLMNLSLKLAKSYRGLQPIMEELWESYIPREKKASVPLKRHGNVVELMARYVEEWRLGEDEPMMEELEQVQRFVLALVSGVSKAAADFGESYSRTYSPDDIENLVMSESGFKKGDRSKNFELEAWKKYCELAKNITPDFMDEEFQKIFGEAMAAWLLSVRN